MSDNDRGGAAVEQKSKATGVLAAALTRPFAVADVRWKPQAVKGNRAYVVAYVDARVVMDRLDDVLGVEGWSDDYEMLPDGSAVCRLRCKLGGDWLTKVDVGSPSEQPDEGDRVKAAFSDALKRAAVKFGVGRYLYRLPKQWVDYDPVKKQLIRVPQLPSWAHPDSWDRGKENLAKALQKGAAAEGKGILPEQRERAEALAGQLGLNSEQMEAGLVANFKKHRLDELTAAEAVRLIDLLEGRQRTAVAERSRVEAAKG